jgi:hypothetical protein
VEGFLNATTTVQALPLIPRSVPGIEGIGDLDDAVVRERNRVVERRVSGCSHIQAHPQKCGRSRTRPRHNPSTFCYSWIHHHDLSTTSEWIARGIWNEVEAKHGFECPSRGGRKRPRYGPSNRLRMSTASPIPVSGTMCGFAEEEAMMKEVGDASGRNHLAKRRT